MPIKKRNVAVIGLGYVGLPVAVELGKKARVIGFDINKKRTNELAQGYDKNNETTKEELGNANIVFTTNPDDLLDVDFYIVAVPTPLKEGNSPDLSILEKASGIVGKALRRGDIVVYESTVYPGATEEVCVPILERYSALRFNQDFSVGYSPERINPGDKKHTLSKIIKVVSASNSDALEVVSSIYGDIVQAGIHRAPSIKVAEAAKVIENSQRDINIAFMNELSIIFDKLNIDTAAVLAAASTKWNFLNFYPGLVGGHCIGVDPYYLTYKAECIGYISEVILSGRRINDHMGKFIAQKIIKLLIRNNIAPSSAAISILGLTFKENIPDLRNSRVVDIVTELKEYGVKVLVHDPVAHSDDAMEEYGIEPCSLDEIKRSDCIVAAVNHSEFKELTPDLIKTDFLKNNGIFVNVRGHYSKSDFDELRVTNWFL